MIAGATGLAGLLILLLLLVFKHNTKIYVQEDGNEYVLGGKERLSKNNKSIDVDKFLDGNTYPNKVKIVLDKKIAEKLDNNIGYLEVTSFDENTAENFKSTGTER